MGSRIFIPSLFVLLIGLACAAPEKVLFGEPAPIGAEARAIPSTDPKEVAKNSSRKARVFTFPSQQQDSRTHNAYVISSPHYEVTEDRFSQNSPAGAAIGDENRLLSLMPTFGNNGMQVGLDFKLPFFSIPYAKMFSALTAPSVGSGFFGSPFGGSPTPGTTNLLTGGGLSSGVATMAAMAATAALLYPKVSGLFSLDGKGVFRDGQGTEDFFQNVNSVLGQFNIDGEACMKVALCSLGNAKRHQQRTRGRDSSSSSPTTTPADIVEDLLNLKMVKTALAKGGLVQARDFGGTGGDCDYYNSQNKCPLSAQTFEKFLSSLG